MIAVLQRVREARVEVDGETAGAIGPGLLILLGVRDDDDEAAAELIAEKTAHLRIFRDEQGKMNRSVLDVGGAALVVSQFTLLGDCRKGRRPSFNKAARPERAIPLYEAFCQMLRARGIAELATGRFAAMMDVHLVNDGPVTIVLDSEQLRAPRRGA